MISRQPSNNAARYTPMPAYVSFSWPCALTVPSLEQFRRDVVWIGVHRHLKVIGIFARLHHRDAKPHYLEDAPRFFAYLDRVLPKYPEFAPLVAIIDRHVRPTLKEYTHWTDGTGDES
jgi:aminoglycoside/choline kinase family phosphotransferase